MKSPDGRDPDYNNREVGLAFYRNPNDDHDAYDVFLGKGNDVEGMSHLYIPPRTLGDLTHSSQSPEGAIRMLSHAIRPDLSSLLEAHEISPSQLHAGFLHVKIKELETERDYWMDEASK